MKYLKYIFGVQLLAGAVWSFYYTVYWAGFLLLGGASIIFVPLIYKLLRKKFNGLESGCLIFAAFFIIFAGFGIYFIVSFFAPRDVNNAVSVLTFEKSLDGMTKACFDGYDNAFSKTPKYREEQCELINSAQLSCKAAMGNIDTLTVPAGANSQVINILNEAKSDAKSSLQSWENFFSMYNRQCNSETSSLNANEIKIQLISAVKSKYLMDVKIKKAKSLVGF